MSGSTTTNECGWGTPSIGVEESTSRVSYYAPVASVLSVIWGSNSGASCGRAVENEGGDLGARESSSDCSWVDSIFEGMSMGLAPLMTVDEMGGGAESDTTGEETTVNSSPLCEVLSSEETGGGMGWVTGGLIEMSGLPSVARAAAMSSEVIERA